MVNKNSPPKSLNSTGKPNPLKKLKGSVHHYDQSFESIGADDWEAVLLEGLTPDAAHADELAAPTLKELGEGPESKR
ncbi:hypothetical protein [Vreelandella profundi]|uniref:hypothetical protein n=1 Tax=Vreelandella profundi TaxID=2852117 RepID=UPI001F417F77|nr:hypothetical protein [Halomonas profundi]